MRPFFSTIIPTYNRAHLLGATLDSVLAQEFDDNEIIVVDDGSTDNTDDLLERYSDRIRVLRQSQQGSGAARNHGIEHARGQYLVFLDSDDLWFPWTLAVHENAIRQFDFPAFLTGSEVRFHDQDDLKEVKQSQPKFSYFADFFSTSDGFFQIIPGAATVRADAVREVDGFSKDMVNAEDSDLWLRLGTDSGFIRITEPPLVGYRLHEVSKLANFRGTYSGCQYLIAQESSGNYPGGPERERERLKILTRFVRPASIKCLHRGEIGDGWRIYRDCFRWHCRLLRFRYLFGFPLLAAVAIIRRNR